MKVYLVKNNNSLIPAYGSDKDKLNKYADGELLQVELKKPRNLKHHRKFFAILNMVVENSDKWVSVRQLLTALKYKLGLYEMVIMFDGKILPAPESISFESMDQRQFETEVYNPAVEILADEIGITVKEIEMNWENYA